MNKSLTDIINRLGKEDFKKPIPLEEYITQVGQAPKTHLRNIFQLMYDMVHHYVPEGEDEYPDDPESINYLKYDTSELFIEGVNQPFFADRLFANRLFNLIDSYKGAQENKIFLFEGPPGSGKSTFLNNFLHKLENYTKQDEGQIYEIIWRIDPEKVGGFNKQDLKLEEEEDVKSSQLLQYPEILDVPCPNHDHPLLIIPKNHREKLLDDIIEDAETKEELFTSKEYDWLFKFDACTVCRMIYDALFTTISSNTDKKSEEIHKDIFNMINARRYIFNRNIGEGVSIFNPGDEDRKEPIRNPMLQHLLNQLFRDSNAVKYVHSNLANTNNGVYAVMDMKGHNRQRFKNLHGIISDGVHKVENIEEQVHSAFMGLINPEDRETIKNGVSFLDRIVRIPIPYVLDYKTESSIFRQKFGKEIEKDFLPHIMDYFAKAVIATRLPQYSPTLEDWLLTNRTEYVNKYCDEDLKLLKAELYAGLIPDWLKEEDVREFKASVRRDFIQEGSKDGFYGISGRKSLEVFQDFYSRYKSQDKYIGIEDVIRYFRTLLQEEIESSATETTQTSRGEADITEFIELAENIGLISREQGDRLQYHAQPGGALENLLNSLNIKPTSAEDSIESLTREDSQIDFGGNPENLLNSLQHLYDFQITQEIRDALYEYNINLIDEEIKNYLFAVNLEKGSIKTNPFTEQELHVTDDFFKPLEEKFLNSGSSNEEKRKEFRHYVQNQYINALAKEGPQTINKEGIKNTEIYKLLYDRYTQNLKENVLVVFKSDSFVRALKDYGTKAFESYDNRIKKDANLLINKLKEKGYNEDAALQMTNYFVDKDIFKKFMD